jgi:hypothetical protein
MSFIIAGGEMGREYSTHGREDECIQGFGGESQNVRDH